MATAQIAVVACANADARRDFGGEDFIFVWARLVRARVKARARRLGEFGRRGHLPDAA